MPAIAKAHAKDLASPTPQRKEQAMLNLFSPIKAGALDLPNRIVMSAMTRTRASEDNVPTPLMAEYFAQRADAGLIVTDCTAVSAQGKGVIRGPGIWLEEQIEGWRLVTDSVHRAGGRIVCQLWHCGRVAHPAMRDGEMPVAPSSLPAEGDFFLDSGKVEFPFPRELSIGEIPGIVADFAQVTRSARAAGFDGVELHGANGYLHDQFLQDKMNRRTDAYGGSARNRSRFMIETAQAMIDAWDANHVGVRLGPSISLYGADDSDKFETFSTVIKGLDPLGLAYICLLEPNEKDRKRGVQIEHVAKTFRPLISGVLLVNTGFTKESGDRAISEGEADAVAYGVSFIANPDLVTRFRVNGPLNKPNPDKFYGAGPEGYTDYPVLERAA
jgi:N-ethylmaleimide reductase